MSSVLNNIQPHEKSVNYLKGKKVEHQHHNMDNVKLHDHVNIGYKYYHTLSNNTVGSVNTISVPPSLHLLKYVILNFKVQGASQSSPVLKDGYNLLARDKAIEIIIPGVSSNLTWSRNALRLYNIEHLQTKTKRDLKNVIAGNNQTLDVAQTYSFSIMIPISQNEVPFPRYLLNDMKILTYFSNNTNLFSSNATTPLISSSKMIFYYNTITNSSIMKNRAEPLTYHLVEPVTRQYAYTTSNTQLVPIVLNGLYQNNELMKLCLSTITTANFNADSYYGVDVNNLILKIGSDTLYEYHEGSEKLRELYELKNDSNEFSLEGSNRFYFSLHTSLNNPYNKKEIYPGIKMGTDPTLEVQDLANATAQTLDVHAYYSYVLQIQNGVGQILK
jgi:hypothetical protein